ncbi:unnamed protein product [Rhizopus stolonifer]
MSHIIQGSTVISWEVDGKERLFVSEKAKRDGSKAIRGGIPICFPIFGTKETIDLPQHGFARNTYWEYLGVVSNDSEVTVRLGLKEIQISPEARKAWPHSFNLIYTVTLTDKTLKTFLSLKNEGKEAFEFNTLLHTYFRVPEVTNSQVQGLFSRKYIDKVQGGDDNVEKNEKVTISQEVDRVYKDVQDNLLLEVGDNTTIAIEKSNLKDTVVWNPWIEKAKGMGDFGDEEYKNMICVEAGSVAEWIKLPSGQSWTAGQTLTIV